MEDDAWMRQAIAAARQGIAAGQSPFGCVIVQGDRVLAACHNQVWATGDPTAHAEVTAIREATRQLGRISLAGCILYSTCEPCPMCASAIHWSKIESIIYGASIADAAAAGFSELRLPAAELFAQGQSRVKICGGCLSQECRELFAEWRTAGRSKVY